jgi:hypothetical protein
MPQPPDLHALTSSALKDIEQAEAVQAARRHKPVPRYPWLKLAAAMLVVLAGYTVMDSRIPMYWLGVSDRQQLAEMTAALTAAKLAVDQSHAATGEWPDRVPLPALAALVELQDPGPAFRLLARTAHWQLTMTPSGDVQKMPP